MRSIVSRYTAIRRFSEALCADLGDEDLVAQSMPDASPLKWHLAHTTWFFEKVVLERIDPDYEPVDPAYAYLFNSYYNALGDRPPRPLRGVLTRPAVP
ncbi:MAG: DinB family protein, partial [Planctomycetes bacterium]|nr:DinB family protein [Planctomycetota bacterium]